MFYSKTELTLSKAKILISKRRSRETHLYSWIKMIKYKRAKSKSRYLDNYKPLKEVSRVISKLHRGNYLDDMTRKWLSQVVISNTKSTADSGILYP